MKNLFVFCPDCDQGAIRRQPSFSWRPICTGWKNCNLCLIHVRTSFNPTLLGTRGDFRMQLEPHSVVLSPNTSRTWLPMLVCAPFAWKETRRVSSTAPIVMELPGAGRGVAERKMRSCTSSPVLISNICWKTSGKHNGDKTSLLAMFHCHKPPTPRCLKTCPPCSSPAQTCCSRPAAGSRRRASCASSASPTPARPQLSGEQSWRGLTWRGGAASLCMWWGRAGQRWSRLVPGQVSFFS